MTKAADPDVRTSNGPRMEFGAVGILVNLPDSIPDISPSSASGNEGPKPALKQAPALR